MEKQKFTRYTFRDQRTGDILQHMQINDRLFDHEERLKKMQVQLSLESRVPVIHIVYSLGG